MEIRENDKICIFTPLLTSLTALEAQKLDKFLQKESRKIAMDLSNITSCSIDFIENIKKIAVNKHISFFNIPSDVFVLFNIMDLDKSIDLFVSELDFESNKHKLINRKFLVV